MIWLAKAVVVARSSLGRNIFSNYFGVAWLAGLSFFTLPFYVSSLGRAGWSIVAASMAVQMFISFLDAGFSQVMPRWIARAADEKVEQSRLYRAFLVIYVSLALAALIVGQLFAHYLAYTWFNAGKVSPHILEWGLRIVIFQLLFQFSNSANIGYWNGRQLQTLANTRQCLFMTLKHAGALLSIYLIARSPFCYLLSFAAFSGLEVLANCWKIAGGLERPPIQARDFPAEEIWEIIQQVTGLSAAVLVGILVSQLDRIVLSKTQDIAKFSTYVIVSNLALAFLQFQGPLTRAFLPQLVRDHLSSVHQQLRTTTHLLTALAAFSAVPCLLAALLAPNILQIWMHDKVIVQDGTLPLRLLLTAIAVNSLYGAFYTNIIVAGRGTTAMAINVTSLLATMAAILVWGTHVGIALGGIIWLSNSVTQLVLGAAWFFLIEIRRQPAAALS